MSNCWTHSGTLSILGTLRGSLRIRSARVSRGPRHRGCVFSRDLLWHRKGLRDATLPLPQIVVRCRNDISAPSHYQGLKVCFCTLQLLIRRQRQ